MSLLSLFAVAGYGMRSPLANIDTHGRKRRQRIVPFFFFIKQIG